MAGKKKQVKSSFPVGMILAGVGLLIGLGFYARSPVANRIPSAESSRIMSQPAPEDTTKAERAAAHPSVETLVPEYKDENLTYVKSHQENPPNDDPVIFAVNKYLDSVPAVPKSARALTCEVKSGIAHINFSDSFARTYGADDETTIVNGILATMKQFKEVDAVQFEVSGKPLETLGNSDLSSPQKIERSA